MQVVAAKLLLVALWVATTGAHQSKWAPSRQARLGSTLRPAESDQDNSLPTFQIDGAPNSNAGELGPKDSAEDGGARTSRNQHAAWGRTDDQVDFIRVDRKVQTGVGKQVTPAESVAKQQAQKLAKQTVALKPASELAASDRPATDSAALDSLNRFLLERPQPERTGGAILGRQLALNQLAASKTGPAARQHAPQTSTTTTTASPQFDYLTRLYLDSSTQLDVRVHLGETAYLLCRLRANLQQSDQLQVSWFRGVEILTSGEFRQTSDDRFRPSHQPGSSDWLLELHNVRASDEGDYECQVNSAPRPASVRVRLAVIAASVEIVEGPELRVDEGEQVELTCRVQFSSQAQLKSTRDNVQHEQEHHRETNDSQQASRRRRRGLASTAANWQPYIYWYKDRVYLQDQRVEKEQRNLSDGGLENVLRVSRASQSDSGSYTCRLVPELNEVRPAQAQVVVVASGCSASVDTNNFALPSGTVLLAAFLAVQSLGRPGLFGLLMM